MTTEDLAHVAVWRAHLVQPPMNPSVVLHAAAYPHALLGHYYSKPGPQGGRVLHAHYPHTPSVAIPTLRVAWEGEGGGSLLPRPSLT